MSCCYDIDNQLSKLCKTRALVVTKQTNNSIGFTYRAVKNLPTEQPHPKSLNLLPTPPRWIRAGRKTRSPTCRTTRPRARPTNPSSTRTSPRNIKVTIKEKVASGPLSTRGTIKRNKHNNNNKTTTIRDTLSAQILYSVICGV